MLVEVEGPGVVDSTVGRGGQLRAPICNLPGFYLTPGPTLAQRPSGTSGTNDFSGKSLLSVLNRPWGPVPVLGCIGLMLCGVGCVSLALW